MVKLKIPKFTFLRKVKIMKWTSWFKVKNFNWKLLSKVKSLNSLVRPRVIWPTLLILLSICVTLYVLKEKEEAIKLCVQQRLLWAIEDRELAVKEFFAEKDQRVALEKELEKKEQIIELTLNKLEKEIAARREVEAELILSMREKDALGENIDEVGQVSGKLVALGRIVVSPECVLNGKVLAVEKEQHFVVVNLGKEDNVKVGDRLSIYQNDAFIGGVQVEKVDAKVCAAVIMPVWRGAEFKENDAVEFWG
jgi:hypothetical protein